MTKELNRQAWARFLIGSVGTIGIIWGASGEFTIVKERSIRNEDEIELHIQKDEPRWDEVYSRIANDEVEIDQFADRSREQYHELNNKIARVEADQQTTLAKVDLIQKQQDKNHDEILYVVRKLEEKIQ